MKRLSILLVIVGAVAVMPSCSSTKSASSGGDVQMTQQLVNQMLERRYYKIDVSVAHPAYGPSFTVQYPYFLSVIGDKVESFLPYFGRAYTVPYGGGEGLNFSAPITGYSIEEGKKGRKIVTFDARTREDNYTFTITVYPTGGSNLNISAGNKQNMSFRGQMDPDPEFEIIRMD